MLNRDEDILKAAEDWQKAGHGVALEEGQFADISLDWGAAYRELAARFPTSLFVTFDYGHPADRLFRGRARRYGTAAAYRGHGLEARATR